MAAGDKLWFELGVRDEVSQVLEKLMTNSQKLASLLSDDATELKNIYKNISDVAGVYDKIYVAQKRIRDLNGTTLSADEKKGLRDMSKELEKVRKEFEGVLKDPERLMGKGEAYFDKLRTNIDLMVKDTLRYVDGIEAKEKAEAVNAANEERRIDSLKAKYYELQRQRQELSNAIANAAPGTNLAEATSLINGISARMGAITNAKNKGGMPGSVVGADSEEFLRRVKAEIANLNSATKDYNGTLETNHRLYLQVRKVLLDTSSQRNIADIKKQQAEYDALGQKLMEVANLMSALASDRTDIQQGKGAVYNAEKVMQELDAINRRYNETLAAGREQEKKTVASRQQLTDASKKSADATRNMTQANQGLMNTFKELEQAGRGTNRMLNQMTQSFATAFSFYGLKRILQQVITIGGQFEFQHIALQNILGDIQEANILFSQLQGLAVESPKTFMELTTYAKQLSAYQIPANELYDTTKRLADLSTGLGVDMGRLILAYGQVRSAAVLRGQELRQFTEAGIPLVQKLADKFTELNGKLTTTADVFKLISARKVPFEMVKDIMWDMTSQGGQFYNMQAELADTLYGKWQKLQDTWQIMLGHLADGKSIMGTTMRVAVEGAVALTRSLDALLPVLATIGASRLFKNNKAYAIKAVSNLWDSQDANAISNMRMAKEKQANRLLMERIQLGRQLTAQEWEMIRTKNVLTSNEYLQLAYAGKISEYKTAQLALDGKINTLEAYRLALAKGYTKEQIRQMQLGNLSMLQRGNMGMKDLWKTGGIMGLIQGGGGQILKGIFNFLGGWVGVAITAAGAIGSIYNAISQENEELDQKGEAMTSHAQQNANSLLKTLTDVEGSSDGVAKKIEVLEDALISMGDEGKRIVYESRSLDTIGERFDTLTAKAKAYQEALSQIGTPSGKALHIQALDDSDIEDSVKTYEDLRAEEAKHHASLQKFEVKYRQMIDALKAKHQELNQELTSTNLFANIRKLMTGEYANEAVTFYAGPARDAMKKYYEAVRDTEKAFISIEKNTIPDLMDEMKAQANEMGIDLTKPFDKLNDTEKETLRAIASNFANSLENAEQDTKNSIANWIAQGFYAQLYLHPVLEDIETGYADVLKKWQAENGTDLWSKQDRKEAKNDLIEFGKKNGKALADLKTRRQQLLDLAKELSPATAEMQELNGQLEDVNKQIKGFEQAKKEGIAPFIDPKTSSKSTSGAKKDTELERIKNRVELYRKFYSEFENYTKLYGKEGAKAKLNADDEFSAVFGFGLTDVENYKKSIDELISTLANTTEARDKFINSSKADIQTKKRKEETEAVKEYVDELQRMLNIMSENYQTYKKWIELTGDSKIAASMAGVAQNTTYAKYLKDEMETALKRAGRSETADSVLGLSLSGAKEFGEESAIFKIWDDYRKEQERARKEDMEELYNATKKLMSVDEEILAIEKQIQELRSKGATSNDPRILAKEKELADKRVQQFENSTPYLRFYSAIMSMTIDEAERTGAAIKANLVDQLAKGQINADKYLKSLKNIDTQLNTIRNKKNDLSLFVTGGIKAIRSQRQKEAEDSLANTTIEIQKLSEEIIDAKKDISKAEQEGNMIALSSAKARLSVYEKELRLAKHREDIQRNLLKSIIGETEKLNDAVAYLEFIVSAFDGIEKAAQQISDMFDALGQESRAEGWSDAASIIGAIGSPVKSATNAIKSAMSGDVGGVISNTVGIITSPITALAKLHDAKLDRAIQKSQKEVKKLGNEYKNIQTAMETALGGIYSTGGYDEMLKNLKKQYKEIEEQMHDEYEKKDTDSDKIEDYRQQLYELDLQIKEFALDMANTLYSIDLHNWSSQLTDAIVGAWEKGEDAVEAYRDKVKDIVKDLTTNILSRKVMEAAFDRLGIDKIIENEMISKSGKIDEGSIVRIAEALNQAGEITVATITGILDQLEKGGYIEKGSDSSSSSASSAISKSITEDTAGLLVSYVNAIRADVSVNRFTLDQILIAVQGIAGENSIAQSQLEQLRFIAMYTLRSAEAAEAINDLFHKVAPDGTAVRMK